MVAWITVLGLGSLVRIELGCLTPRFLSTTLARIKRLNGRGRIRINRADDTSRTTPIMINSLQQKHYSLENNERVV